MWFLHVVNLVIKNLVENQLCDYSQKRLFLYEEYSFLHASFSHCMPCTHTRHACTHATESHSRWRSRSLGRPWYSWDDTRRAPSPRRRRDLSIYKCRSTWHSTVRFVIITASRERAETRQTAAGPSRDAASIEIFGSNVFWRCSKF